MPLSGNLELNVSVILPELTLVCFALLVMLADVFTPNSRNRPQPFMPWLALFAVIVTALVTVWLWSQPPATFQNMATSDHFALAIKFIVLIAAGLGILLSADYIPNVNAQTGEYYALLLLATTGMMVMGSAVDLIVVFLALEIFSLALYILSGLQRENPRSIEASLKYFLLGAFASSFFVYGAALVYGATGSTQYRAIANMLANGNADPYILLPGIALLLVGFGFKVSLVPFHMWTPDVYQGAPTPVTAFMSVGTKAAGFAAFIRVLIVAIPAEQATWGWALAIMAILTMTIGNFAALRQTSLKRMLAYSSIAHAGYILVGLTPGTSSAATGALFYLFTYAFMNMGAFAIVIALEKANADDALQNRAAGIANHWPRLAFAMAIFMFSLSGVPPLAGFFGKFFVFKAAVDGGWAWLAAIGMINSAVAAYYYLRVTVAMYFETTDAATSAERAEDRRAWLPLQVGVALASIFTVLIGIYPGLWAGIFQTGLGN